MSNRARRSALSDTVSLPPGSVVRWYANGLGWPLDEKSVLVEGELDQKYLILASDLYRQVHHRELMGPPLAIFPTGIGDAGGTDGILQHYPTIRSLVERDTDVNNRRTYRVIVLPDSDSAGKKALNRLRERYASLRDNYDVFLLHRHLPRVTREPAHLTRLLSEQNNAWSGLDCEIEDLLSWQLLDEFVREDPRRCRCDPQRQAGGHHFEFARDAKSALFRFARDYANINDFKLIVELLKSIRYYLGLDPEGDPVSE